MANDGSDIHPHAQTATDPVAAAEALKFFAWAYTKGDKMAEDLDYVPMPKKVVSEIEKVWAKTPTASRSTSPARWRNRCHVCPPVL